MNRGGNYGGGRFAPAGYGGAAAAGYRNNGYGGGPTSAPAGYGYPQQVNAPSYYGGAGMAAVQGGYPAYGAAAGAPAGYGECICLPRFIVVAGHSDGLFVLLCVQQVLLRTVAAMTALESTDSLPTNQVK